jgi:antitoxin component YwqK of YwqJK toxin-antitoxin module
MWEFYWNNNQLHSKGSYVNGLQEGIWVYYYTDGRLYNKKLFENGYFIDFVK